MGYEKTCQVYSERPARSTPRDLPGLPRETCQVRIAGTRERRIGYKLPPKTLSPVGPGLPPSGSIVMPKAG